MKAVFLSYNQALTDRVNAIFDEQGIRGFTKWGLDRGPRLGRRRTPLRHACVAFDERLDPGHRRRREGGSADGRLPRNGRCDQDAGVPGVCLEYRKRILIPLLAAHLPHILPAGRTDRTRVRSRSPRFSRRPASAPHGPESRFRRFRDIRRPEAVFETYAAMRCEK